jgi:nitrate/nitrite-specific signal transduction histidine kinase
MKHGKAQRVVIGLAKNAGVVTLEIKDDGVGLAKSDTKSNGIGMRVMNYRAGMIGASLTITSQRSGGTMVQCQLPVGEPVKAPAGVKAAKRASRVARPRPEATA